MKNWAIIISIVLLILMLITAADNYSVDGQVVASDEISEVNYPLVKPGFGVADSFTPVSISNPLPTSDTGGGLAIAQGKVTGQVGINVFGQTINADATATDVWAGSVDTAIYVAPTQARVHNITSTSALDARAAATFTMADAGTEDEILTIAAKVYTLRDILTDVDGYVLREVTASATIDNIIAAINLTGTPGVDYAASTTANAAPTTAFVGDGDTMLLYAKSAIVTTSTVNSGFGAAAAVLGTGAQTVIIRGLTSWTTTEVSETLDMFGVDISPTTNSYVFINSLERVASGGTTTNAGIIKATAATDSSVSAYIPIGDGISHSAIMGVPSIETFYLDQLLFTIFSAGTTDNVDFTLLVNKEPTSQLTQFNEHFGTGFVGSDMQPVPFNTPLAFAGPCIIKLRALSDTADSHVGARFSGVLGTN